MVNLLIVGLGNVGMPLADFIARRTDLCSVVLVDADNFSSDNVFGQLVTHNSVGAAKVDVAAARIAKINPAIAIEPRKCRLEDLPRGLFLNGVVISGLDTRYARVKLSQICFATGADFWLDMGVRPQNRLARVSTVWPSVPEAACLCCGYLPRDWDALSAEFRCDGVIKSAPTRSPVNLGAAAAAMAAEILDRYVAGTLERSREVQHQFFSLSLHKAWITRVGRNAECRSAHERWEISGTMPHNLDLESATISVPGLPFVRTLRCSCGAEKPVLFIAARLTQEQKRCPICGQTMHYGAFDLVDEIDFSAIEDYGPEKQALALAGIGVVEHDVVHIGGNRYFEIGRQRAEHA